MKGKIVFTVMLFCLVAVQAQVRREIRIPDLPEYKTLKCDFHTHSVFSDGLVWPTIRAEEAYIEGLDAIAITEHVEFRPFHNNEDMQGDHNRSYELASGVGQGLGILIIRGSEITRSMPPGHWNAIFLQDCNPLNTPEYENAFKAAAKQKAYIFWNHPGWYPQAFETTKWYDEHTKLYEQGYMHGIEVANGVVDDYYPEAHQWALDKNLTMLGNSDIHHPTSMNYDFAKGEHRTMTLVFAKERTIESIRDALENRRTVAWHRNILVGREDLMKELFKQLFKVENVSRNKDGIRFTVVNDSDFTLVLKKEKHDMNLLYFKDLNIKPGERVSLSIRFQQPTTEKVKMDFTVVNFYTTPNKGMNYSIEFE